MVISETMTEEAQQTTEAEQDDVFKKDVYCTHDTIWVYSTKQCANCLRTYCKKHPCRQMARANRQISGEVRL